MRGETAAAAVSCGGGGGRGGEGVLRRGESVGSGAIGEGPVMVVWTGAWVD